MKNIGVITIIGIIMFGMVEISEAYFQGADDFGSSLYIDGKDSYSFNFDTPLDFTVPTDIVTLATLKIKGTPDPHMGETTVMVAGINMGTLPSHYNNTTHDYIYDLTPLFTTWTGGKDNLPFDLSIQNHGNNDGFTLNSAEFDLSYTNQGGSTPPVGNDPVPEPATLLLLGSGLSALLLRFRKSPSI